MAVPPLPPVDWQQDAAVAPIVAPVEEHPVDHHVVLIVDHRHQHYVDDAARCRAGHLVDLPFATHVGPVDVPMDVVATFSNYLFAVVQVSRGDRQDSSESTGVPLFHRDDAVLLHDDVMLLVDDPASL